MTEQREAVTFLLAGGLSEPRACALIHIPRSTFRYVAQPRDDTVLLDQIQQLAARHPRYGYRRISALLRALPMSTRIACNDCGGSIGSRFSGCAGVGRLDRVPLAWRPAIQAIFGPMILWRMRSSTAHPCGS